MIFIAESEKYLNLAEDDLPVKIKNYSMLKNKKGISSFL